MVADEAVTCYGFSVERLTEACERHPRLMTKILGDPVRDGSERLRRANAEIRALD